MDGKTYAIPLDTHPFVLYYNVEVCDKAGLLDSAGQLKPIKGTDQLGGRADGRQGGHRGVRRRRATINEPSTPWRWFQTLYSQQGGSPWLADGGQSSPTTRS